MEDKLLVVQDVTKELLEQIGLAAEIEVQAEDDIFNVSINADDNALLIGKHGNTLSSFEHILALAAAQKLGDFHRIIVEVGDYRKEREQYLEDLVGRLRDEVTGGSGEKTIRGLKPWERRFVHMLLAEDGNSDD